MAMRSKPIARQSMTWHLSNFIRPLAVGLVATPMAFAQDAPKEYALKTEPPKNFIMHETPERSVVLNFEDGEAQPRSLADFHGKVVLLNIWATWCPPCIKEIPALDRLVAALTG